MQCSFSYSYSDVCRSLARLSSLPLALQGHGNLLWLVLIQQWKTLQQLLLHCHLLGFTGHCNPETKQLTISECSYILLCIHACTYVSPMMWRCFNQCISMYLACSCRMLRSCCTSSAAALESVRQVVGTSATGAFCFCSSGAGRGSECFCRLDRIRSLAAHQGTQSTTFN